MITFSLLLVFLTALVIFVLIKPLLISDAGAPAQFEKERAASNTRLFHEQLAELTRDHTTGLLTDADYIQAKVELQRRLLEDVADKPSIADEQAAENAPSSSSATAPAPAASSSGSRGLALSVGILLPFVALVFYLLLGTPAALNPAALVSEQPSMTAEQIEGMVSKLAARLKDNPDQPEAWAMLARSYKFLGRYSDALEAYAHTQPMLSGEPDILTDYAETLALNNERSFRGKASTLLAQALTADPDYPQALLLSGIAAYERSDYSAAIRHWERLLQQLPKESEDAQVMRENIAQAKKAAVEKALSGSSPDKK